MDWSVFDGHLFETARQVAGEWVVQIQGQQVQIRVTVDGDGQYFYTNSHWFKSRQDSRPPAFNRVFASQNEALAQAVKDLKAPFQNSSHGEWIKFE